MIRHSVRWQLAADLMLLAALAPSTYGGRGGSGLPEAEANAAKALVEAAGVKGGLVVVIGCDAPALLAELRGAGSYLVHGLDADPGNIAAARRHLLHRDLYGPVTVCRLRGRQLPYVDSLVNMIVVAAQTQIPVDEMTRALAPGGVIADIRKPKARITRKGWPEELDEWTHYLHNASNNAVSKDTVVGPPRGLRWTCGPKYPRSHEHFASMSAMVTAGGRVFYIIDEGPISSAREGPHARFPRRRCWTARP